MAIGLQKISLATRRQFKEERELDLIYAQLKHIPEKDFEEAIEDYISVDRPPDNFIGFIKRRAFEIKLSRESRPAPFEKTDLTEADTKMFMLCISKAMAARKLCGLNFDYWVSSFNSEFEKKSGQELSGWLFAKLVELNDMIRGYQASRKKAVEERLKLIKNGGAT